MGEGTGGHENVASVFDVVGFNYAEANYDSFHEKYPDWVLYGSETSSATRSRGVYSHPESNNLTMIMIMLVGEELQKMHGREIEIENIF